MRIVNLIIDFAKAHKFLISGISLAMLLVSIILVPFFIQNLPADYFKKRKIRSKPAWVPFPLHILYLVVKNIIGIVLIIMGLAMIVLPGQGLITLIIGIILTDIPGERKAFLFVLRKTPVLKGMNWLRKKKNIPLFELPEE
ncbi:MAG: hypothetical protein K8R76_06365 [Candidatus Aegiribacteria sp.]|nr:hypothetical protein [Candidatus Aegiribacteria sp.]